MAKNPRTAMLEMAKNEYQATRAAAEKVIDKLEAYLLAGDYPPVKRTALELLAKEMGIVVRQPGRYGGVVLPPNPHTKNVPAEQQALLNMISGMTAEQRQMFMKLAKTMNK